MYSSIISDISSHSIFSELGNRLNSKCALFKETPEDNLRGRFLTVYAKFAQKNLVAEISQADFVIPPVKFQVPIFETAVNKKFVKLLTAMLRPVCHELF